ncbi:MAG: helix-turn-helix domain-containing protein [Rickettsiales bacterium]|nr:helix-turn-helix domain-containing protein [Rickettsiales bacterium]
MENSENQKINLRKEFIESSPEALLNTKVVAAFINKSVSWFNIKAVYGGGIPYTKLGNLRLYRKSDVIDWLEKNGQRVHSTSEYGRIING